MGKTEEKKINKNKKFGKLQVDVLVRTVLPIFFMGIVIAFYASEQCEKMLYEQMKPMLTSVASTVKSMYDELYPGEYVLVGDEYVSIFKGEKELNGDYSLIDQIKKESGMEITLFYMDARILTTLKDAEGNRYIGTPVNSAIYNGVADSMTASFYNADIDDTEYYVCYMPIVEDDGEMVGMIGVARKTEDIAGIVRKTTGPIWLITLLCMVVAGYFSVIYTKELVEGIHYIRVFLQRMTKGELNGSIQNGILKRNDEIGDTGRSIMEMQNAVRVLVERDPLTTLYNRRYGTAKLKKIQKQSEKNGMPYSIALGDIDHFKKVNDVYGHEAGDIVLIKVAEQLKKAMAGKGFVTRWGGEEFLLVYDKCGIEDAAIELEKFLEAIRAMEIHYQGQLIKITMSLGVVDGSVSQDHGELLRQADARLYYGKMHGRNQVVSKTIMDETEEEAKEESKNCMVVNSGDNQKPNQEDIAAGKSDSEQKSEEEQRIEQLKQNKMVEEIIRKMAGQLLQEAEDEEIDLDEVKQEDI